MHNVVYLNFFEGTLRCEQNDVDGEFTALHAQDETNAGMPEFAGTPSGKPTLAKQLSLKEIRGRC
jgi:hypothetical protein